jgi:DNA-directed RNA polymerase specialized sigma24 family protein
VVDRDLVDTILQQLPECERSLAQRRMDGSEWGEIAADLNIEAETLRKRFSRSVERVLRRLKLQDRPSLVG